MKDKPSVAIVRGKYLNKFEMQSYEPLIKDFRITAFSSKTPFQDKFEFPMVKLFSPMDLPEFPYKTQVLNRIFKDTQYLFDLKDKIKGFDIAHSAESYYHYTIQCLNAKKRGYVKKVVVTEWENIPFNNEGIWGRKAFKKRTREEADQFIAVSTKAKEALIEEGADEKKITIIHPGIDIKKFTPRKINHNGINILFVGRLEEEKGVLDLINAFAKIIKDRNNLRLTIIGKGTKYNDCLDLEEKLGIRNFVTHKSIEYGDLPMEYNKADIFIAPSKPTKYWQEQWGMMLMEAQASGLPIVTTDTGSIPENVGDAAIIIEPGNVSEIFNELKKFIENPKLCLEYGKKARGRAEKLYDIQTVSKQIKNVYVNLV